MVVAADSLFYVFQHSALEHVYQQLHFLLFVAV
jgi:hypothetical protein